MISCRDFIVKREFRKLDNGYDIFFRSVSDDFLPPTKEFVRGELLLQCCSIREDGEKTKLTMINQIKLNGNLDFSKNF
jgi:hypothetical protein